MNEGKYSIRRYFVWNIILNELIVCKDFYIASSISRAL